MKTNVMEIYSQFWTKAYVLDVHTVKSSVVGQLPSGQAQFNTIRSEVGESLYQLKYCNDFNQIELLASEIAKKICPLFPKISFVVPVPPSKQRHRQPVIELAEEVSKKIERKFTANFLTKATGSAQIKNLASKEAKVEQLVGRYIVNDFLNQGQWNVLVVDDLYSSGATIEAVCATLRKCEKINEIYVAIASRARGGIS